MPCYHCNLPHQAGTVLLVIMFSLTSLPHEVLKLVLQHVPLKHRLSSCSLVSKACHAAAAAATEELDVSFSPSDRCAVLQRHSQNMVEWMSRYGHHVTSLDVYGFPEPLEQLPSALGRLQALTLYSCQLRRRPAAAGGQLAVLSGCTKLTRLELIGAAFDPPQDDGGAVIGCSCLADLQHLSVQTYPHAFSIGGLCGGSLPSLQRLTYLNISRLSADNMLQLGALTALESLELHAHDGVVVGPRSMPGFLLPPSLTRLVVCCGVEAGLLSVVPTGLKHLVLDEWSAVEGPVQGPGSFLAGIARLKQLTEFVLQARNDLAWPPPGPAYSAFTASSGLLSLTISGARFPAGTWPFVFPAGHTLPHLTALTVKARPEVQAGQAPPAAWGPADLRSLLSYCPHLCDIPSAAVQLGPHVSELHKLTGLTCFGVTYSAGDAAAVMDSFCGLAALVQLQELTVHVRARDDAAVLLPLTSLTALQNLDCSWDLPDVGDNEPDHADIDFYSSQDMPPVWLQILLFCSKESSCRTAARRSLMQQLDGPRAAEVHKAVALHYEEQLQQQQLRGESQDRRIAQQEGQIGSLQTQLREHAQWLLEQREAAWAKEGQVAEQERRIAELQRQLAAQQQMVQQQAAQIAGLRGQLAEQQQAAAQQAARAGVQQQVAEQQAARAGVQQQQVAEQQAAQIAGLQAQLQDLLQRLPG